MSQLQQHDYLLSEVRALLAKSVQERIGFIDKGTYVPYPRAQQILDRLERLFSRPSGVRPLGSLISAPSGNGKSTIFRVFVKTHPTKVTPEAHVIPVLEVEAPPIPGEKRFLGAMLRAFGADVLDRGDVEHRMNRVTKYIEGCGVKLILVDEVHNLLSGSGRQLEETCNLMKYISNQFSLPTVLAGTERAENVVRSDPQLVSRFPIVTLPPWKDGGSYRTFLRLMESTLPLANPSNVASDEIASYLLQESGGILGDIVLGLKEAAVNAILDGTERITINHLKRSTFSSQQSSLRSKARVLLE